MEFSVKEVKNNVPNVCIIILNWNSWGDTIDCLKSLFNIKYTNYDILIVDNASEDDSVNKIVQYLKNIGFKFSFFEYNSKTKHIKCIYETENNISELGSTSPRITIIENDNNYGFAKGNNIGIEYTNKNPILDYILLLNNDTIVDEEVLNNLINVAELKHKIGFVGPKVYYHDFNGRKDIINFAGGSLNMWKGQASHNGINELDKGQFDTIKEVDYVQGSCILFKKEIIKKVGLMNSDYFMYWEEVDWCVRGLEMGYKSVFAPKAKIWHKISSSSGGSLSFNVIYYLTRNRFIFMKKNASKSQSCLFLLYFLFFDIWVNLIFFLKEKNKNACMGFFKGFKEGIYYTLIIQE
jgi:GT2 family glycosyltransferase